MLHALRARLRADALVSYTPFVRSRALGNGLVSTAASGNDGPWTLWQSGAAMNESGGGVRAAWSAWARDNRDGRLVVLYDELEMALGGVKVRGGSASARSVALHHNPTCLGAPPTDLGLHFHRHMSDCTRALLTLLQRT